MTFYSDASADALAILQEFGMIGSLTKRAGGAYNSSTGKVTMVPTVLSITVAIVGQPDSRRSNSATVHKQRRAIIAQVKDAAGVDVLIDSEDVITVGTERFKVVDPGRLAPAGETVLYDAVLES